MEKSPGHEKWPGHKVVENHLGERVQVFLNGENVADSTDVIRVDEDEHPARYYLPRADVRMDHLTRTQKVTECPFKGTAHYFSATSSGKTFADVVWTYEDPYAEHRDLADRVAFDNTNPALEIRAGR